MSFWHNFSDLLVCGKQLISSITSRPKEKDEDLNCEYEMMWDAEGSMHLVKKASNVSVTSKSEKISVERFASALHLPIRVYFCKWPCKSILDLLCLVLY